ncbi:MAG TPA: hypothetical protein VGG10_11045 [Rhizomicrobium sp.]|jgi:hypothetical protein
MATLPLEIWRDFFVMVGTAAGAILGATFVVATLTSNVKERNLGLRGFITPTAVHLGSAMVGSSILTMPVLAVWMLAAAFGAGGAAGVIYCVIVWTRIRHLKIDLADRCWYVGLPTLCYLALATAPWLALMGQPHTLEILAVVMIAMLVIGARNAWDMATFMITRDNSGPSGPET